jgi:6-phosphogluconolactonase (cycloisomerase 2 family)
LSSIAVTAVSASIVVGGTDQFTATGTYSDGTTKNITTTVTWTSGATATATVVSTSGLATGVAAGSTTIIATLGSVTGNAALTVTAPIATLASIAVTAVSASIVVGGTDQFTATGTYSDGTTKNITTTVTWSSGATATATVVSTSGLATGVAAGSTTIIATLGTVTGNAALTVTAPVVTLVSITITPAAPTLFNGTTQQLTATGNYSNGTHQTLTTGITWTSSVPTVATVSAAGGLATAVGIGTTQVTAASASPSVTSPAIPVKVVAAEFAFAANFGSANVSQYTVAAGGDLTPQGTAVAAGTGAFALAVEPTGHYLYVANFGTTALFGSTVSQYSIGANGLLTPLLTPTVNVGPASAPNGVTATKDYVYVADYGTGKVSQFSISPTDGTLQNPAVVAAGSGPSMVALSPSGAFAYVPNYSDNMPAGTVSVYSVNATNGTLTPVGAAVTAGAGANFVAIDPSGKYAYVANLNGNSISQFNIDANTGELTPMSTATVTTTNPRSIAIDPNGPYVYVANGVSTVNTATVGETVSQYTISSSGSLVPMTPATVETGVGPNSVTVDISNQYVYVVNRGTISTPATTVQQFAIGAGGGLTPLTPPTATAGTAPAAIVTSTAPTVE